MNRALVLLALVACRSSSNPDDSPKPAPVPRPSDGIVVDKPGAEPRQPLRYRLAKGTATAVELTMDLDVDERSGSGAGSDGGLMPTLDLTMVVAVDDVAPDGSATLRTTIEHAIARDRSGSKISATAMTAQTSRLDGIAIVATLSPSGAQTNSHFDANGHELSAAVTSQLATLAQSLEKVAMPLPAEPIGAGAVWHYARAVEDNGLKLDTVTTIELVSIVGDKLAIRSATQITGRPQKVEQAGVAIEVANANGHGDTHGTLDLARMVIDGELGADFSSAMTVQGSQATVGLKLRMTMARRDQGAHSAP